MPCTKIEAHAGGPSQSFHYKRVPATRIVAGQAAALALKKVKRGAVRKGMVLVAPQLQPVAAWEFDAEIVILTHSSTIAVRYQARTVAAHSCRDRFLTFSARRLSCTRGRCGRPPW